MEKPPFLYHGSCKGITGPLTPRPQNGDINGMFPDGERSVVFATDDEKLAALYTLKTPEMLSTGEENGMYFTVVRDIDRWKDNLSHSKSEVYALPSESFTNTITARNGLPSKEWQSRVEVMPDHVIAYTPEKAMQSGGQIFVLDKAVTAEMWRYTNSATDTFSNRIEKKYKSGELPENFTRMNLMRELMDAGIIRHMNAEMQISPVATEKSLMGEIIKEDIDWLKEQMKQHAAATALSLEMLDPKTINSDREAYQFRLGSAATGEVETHKITDTEWNPLKHGAPLIVHKRKNGELFVVDGHHRLAFAKRLLEEGKQVPQLAAYVLEEEKGISIKDAKLMAAFADISRGQTNVGDAAAAIKEVNEPDPSLHKERLPVLPSIGNIPQAYKLASLSYQSLGLVSSGDVPAQAAEMVIDRVKDPEKRERVIGIISAKLKQDYPNWQPNNDLAVTLAPKSNDNEKSFVDALKRERASQQSFSLGA